MLVDVCYFVIVDVQSCSEVFCSEYVVQVCNVCEVFGVYSSEELV